jgi:hypothetical protein
MIMLNMTLHFRLICSYLKINYDNQNNIYNYDSHVHWWNIVLL